MSLDGDRRNAGFHEAWPAARHYCFHDWRGPNQPVAGHAARDAHAWCRWRDIRCRARKPCRGWTYVAEMTDRRSSTTSRQSGAFPGRASIEKVVDTLFQSNDNVLLNLHQSDFWHCHAVADAVNEVFGLTSLCRWMRRPSRSGRRLTRHRKYPSSVCSRTSRSNRPVLLPRSS